eukprot:gene8066-159_t
MVVLIVLAATIVAAWHTPCSNYTTQKMCTPPAAAAAAGAGAGACAWDFYIAECCNQNVSNPSPAGGIDCPCTTPCCAHRYNDPKIQPQAVAAYKKATAICQSGSSGYEYCFPNPDGTTLKDMVQCCDPQGDNPTGPMPPWLCEKLIANASSSRSSNLRKQKH